MGSAQDLPTTFDEAHDAVGLALSAGMRAAYADRDWAELAVFRLKRDLTARLVAANPLAALSTYDAKHGTQLSLSIGVWLRNDRDTARSAEQLGIHPNTLRYRLTRAQRIAGLDLKDANQRIVAELVLAVNLQRS